MDYVFLGPPGCGKGTQAQLLTQKHYFHLCAGELLRLEVKKRTTLGNQIGDRINQGQLVPDALISNLVAPYVSNSTGSKGIIYDGYPRSIRQAEDLDLILRVLNRLVIRAFWFAIPDEVLLRRIEGRVACQDCQYVYHLETNPPRTVGVCDQCGGTSLLKRRDDDGTILKKRLDVYHEQTKPIMDYYREQGKLIVVDAHRSIEEIHHELSSHLGKNY